MALSSVLSAVMNVLARFKNLRVRSISTGSTDELLLEDSYDEIETYF